MPQSAKRAEPVLELVKLADSSLSNDKKYRKNVFACLGAVIESPLRC
jgi:hypothetical protein